jgi:hypothetical protein
MNSGVFCFDQSSTFPFPDYSSENSSKSNFYPSINGGFFDFWKYFCAALRIFSKKEKNRASRSDSAKLELSGIYH